MICEACKQNVATVHLTEKSAKKPSKETHLCGFCAERRGIPDGGESSVKEPGAQPKEEPRQGMNKIDQAFESAWASGLQDRATAKLILGHDEGYHLRRDKDIKAILAAVARTAFAAGAQAFSTMPLCEHGVAIWGVEVCEDCTDPGEFPGYNRPFNVDLPESTSKARIADLRVEHESMRLSLLHSLVKVGVIDKESVNAPWDPVLLVQFVGTWLSDGFPWIKQGATHRQLSAAIGGVRQRIGALETKVANHICDHEEGNV